MELWGTRRCLRWRHDGFQLGAAAGQQGLAMQHRGPVGAEHNTGWTFIFQDYAQHTVSSNQILLRLWAEKHLHL